MKPKKSAAFILAVFALLTPLPQACAERAPVAGYSAVTDHSSGKLTVTVRLNGGAPYVNIAIIKPGKTGISEEAPSDALLYAKQQATGSFEVPLAAETVVSEWYTLRIGGSGVVFFERPIYIPSKTEQDAFVDGLNAIADGENLAAHIESNRHIAGLASDEYAPSERLPLATILKNTRNERQDAGQPGFTGILDFTSRLSDAKILDAVNRAGTAEIEGALADCMAKGLVSIGESLINAYKAWGTRQKEAAKARLAENAPYYSAGELAEGCLTAVALTSANTAQYGEMSAIIAEYANYFELDLSYYNLLTAAEKTTLYKSLTLSYAKKEDFKAKFYDESKKLHDSRAVSGGSPGGNDGGGSPSYNKPALPPVDGALAAPPSANDGNFGTVFSDLGTALWAADAIASLYGDGIVNGTSENEFTPNANVTREQFVKMLTGALNIKAEGSAEFSDTRYGDWHYPYISAAAGAGIVNGLGDGRFGVGLNISREDIAVMAIRALNAAKVSYPINVAAVFADESEISGYAKDAVWILSGLGVINGKGNALFEPLSPATRAEAAVILSRMRELIKTGGKAVSSP